MLKRYLLIGIGVFSLVHAKAQNDTLTIHPVHFPETIVDTLQGVVLSIVTLPINYTIGGEPKEADYPVPKILNAICIKSTMWPCPGSNIPCVTTRFFNAHTRQRIPDEDVLLFKKRAFIK